MKQVRLHIQSLPVYTPAGDPIYASGNFNDWDTGDAKYQFQREADGTYILELETQLTEIQFRCHRGSWNLAEGDEQAKPNPIRDVLLVERTHIIPIHISSWIDFSHEHFAHTASSNVRVIHPEFYIPQLNRIRRVIAYLPTDYFLSSKRYPVLYMQDGQNIFDTWETISGEWNVDDALDSFFNEHGKSAIVIGIDNGGRKRIDEYAPWINDEEGGGEGSAYAAFLAETLKPFIDKNLRTLPDREHTGIIGSSMGGLISLFTALKYQDLFGAAAIFSPSLWFSDHIFNFIKMKGCLFPQRFMLLAGGRESDFMTTDILKLYFALLDAGFDSKNIFLDIRRNGTHSEWFWRSAFPSCFRQMFFPGTAERDVWKNSIPAIIHFNTQSFCLEVNIDQRIINPAIKIKDINGSLVRVRTLFYCNNYIKLPGDKQIFIVELYNENKLFYSSQISVVAQWQMTG